MTPKQVQRRLAERGWKIDEALAHEIALLLAPRLAAEPSDCRVVWAEGFIL